MRQGVGVVAAITALVTAALPICAEEWVLPVKNGGINVVADSGVDNTGRTDVTAKLNRILASVLNRRMIYFPRGTYLLSGSVFSPDCGAGATTRGPVIIGESTTGTVFRLADGTWPTDNLNLSQFPSYGTLKSRVVLNGGDCGNNTYGKEMRNFTVDIGSNNDGAIGMNYSNANYGGVSNVRIISRDGKGCIGVSLAGGEIGPGLVRGVYVKGFKAGVYIHAADDISVSQVVLEDQTRYGVLNAWTADLDSVKFTTSASTAIAVYNRGNGRLVFLDGFFNGNSTSAAITNEGSLFARNIHTSGFSRAITSTTPVNEPTGAYLEEYASHGVAGVWYTPGKSMNLPIRYAPFPAWQQDTAKWSSVKAYKGGGGIGQRVYPDSTAVRQAFTTPGKTSVCIDYGSYAAADTLFIEGDIERVFGTAGSINTPAVVIRNNNPPVVVISMLEPYNNYNLSPVIVRSSKTVILEAVNAELYAQGTGDLFINGMMGRLIITNPLQKVWVRGYNGEGVFGKPFDSTDIVVTAGQTWLMGYKTENAWGKAFCSGGYLEMFSILAYRGCQDLTIPLFRVTGNGQFSMAQLTQISFSEPLFPRLVSETRNGEERTLTNAQSPGGYNLTLYTGYNQVPAQVSASMTAAPARGGAMAAVLDNGVLRLTLTLSRRSPVSVRVIDMRGRGRTLHAAGRALDAGPQRLDVDAAMLAPGMYCVQVDAAEGLHSRQMVLVGR